MREVAVLGGGHGALAVAGDLALRGFRVHLALRNRSRFGALFESGRLKLCGALQGEAELASISDDHTAVARRADVILVPLPWWRRVWPILTLLWAGTERVLGAPTFYGFTELYGPGVGIDCCLYEGTHYRDDHFVVEVIDPATAARCRPVSRASWW